MARDLLQGIAPPRPVFLPIVFSLGARVENLPLPVFFANPTKISNALRQIRSRLPADGVTCYFDPFLEVEAMGAALCWSSDDQPPSVCWPNAARRGELPSGLRSPEQAVKAGRVPVACDVIRRLASLLRDDALLMAGICGPLTLAARLLQFEPDEVRGQDLPAPAVELAAAVLTQIASALLEAGAHVLLIHEQVLARLSAESCEAGLNMLSPVFNIIRFYGALPLLLLPNAASAVQDLQWMANCSAAGALPCPALEASSVEGMPPMATANFGVAMPLRALASDEAAELLKLVMKLSPAVITTAADVPPSVDLKRVAALFEEVRR